MAIYQVCSVHAWYHGTGCHFFVSTGSLQLPLTNFLKSMIILVSARGNDYQ